MAPRGFHRLRHPPSLVETTAAAPTQMSKQPRVWNYDSWLFPLHPRRYHHHHRHHRDRGDHAVPHCHDHPSHSLRFFPFVSCRTPDVADDTLAFNETVHLLQAADLLSCMHTSLPIRSYMSLLKACIKHEAPAHARQVYSHLIQHSTGMTPTLGDYLAITFAKCGAIDDACHIFQGLPHRTVLSWTSIISAFVDSGCSEEALEMLQFMQEDGVEPDSYTFVSLLKACGSINDLEQGKRLHLLAHAQNFTCNVFVGNTLVSMYGKCGAVLEAEGVFNALCKRTIVSWNAMLSVYIEDDQAEHALLLYRQMLEEHVNFDQLACIFALQACGRLAEKEIAVVSEGKFIKVMSLEIGKALRSSARMEIFLFDVLVGTALLSMYGKCGAIVEARDVFCSLSKYDVVSWNAMLSAYIQQDQGEKALQLYLHMEKKFLSPDHYTYVLVFQACGSFGDKKLPLVMEGVKFLEIGQALHADACRQGFDLNLTVGNGLVSMYGKHKAIVGAEHVFRTMCNRDVVSWRMMLSVYVDQGKEERAFQLYRQMQEEGVTPDEHVLLLAVQACGSVSQKDEELIEVVDSINMMPLEMGQALLVDACNKGFFSTDIFVGNALVSMYGKCVGLAEAQDVFEMLSKRDVVSWTAMLSAYVEHGQGRKALQFYKLMHDEGIAPNEFTLVTALHACGTLVNSDKPLVKGRCIMSIASEIVHALHSDAHRMGFTADTLVRNTFLATYGKCGKILEAEKLFNTYAQRDVVAWNAMLSAYLEEGLGEEAWGLYRQMQKHHAVMDDITLISLLHASSDIANSETCKELHFDAVSAGDGHITTFATALIHAYGSCASMEDGQAVFDQILKPDKVSWCACIDGHARLGGFVASAHALESLKLAGFEPDEAILTSVLLACSNSGFVLEGLDYCVSTRKRCGVILNMKHYGIMVDLFGHVGDFKKLENMLRNMSLSADLTMWLSLLGACHKHGNIELAEWVFSHALLLDPKEATMFVVMSNIYAEAELEKCAAEVEYYRIWVHEQSDQACSSFNLSELSCCFPC